MRQRLWRSTAAESGYYRAWWNSNETDITALLSGSLYGAVWSFLLGEGPTTDPASMRAHLATEKEYNLGPYGILTGYNMRNEWRNKGFQPPDNSTGHSGIGLTADGGYILFSDTDEMATGDSNSFGFMKLSAD